METPFFAAWRKQLTQEMPAEVAHAWAAYQRLAKHGENVAEPNGKAAALYTPESLQHAMLIRLLLVAISHMPISMYSLYHFDQRREWVPDDLVVPGLADLVVIDVLKPELGLVPPDIYAGSDHEPVDVMHKQRIAAVATLLGITKDGRAINPMLYPQERTLSAVIERPDDAAIAELVQMIVDSVIGSVRDVAAHGLVAMLLPPDAKATPITEEVWMSVSFHPAFRDILRLECDSCDAKADTYIYERLIGNDKFDLTNLTLDDDGRVHLPVVYVDYHRQVDGVSEPHVCYHDQNRAYTASVQFPSGKLLANDWFRLDNPGFNDATKKATGHVQSINHATGRITKSLAFADLNIAYQSIGNTCPSVWKIGDILIIGYMDDEVDEEADEIVDMGSVHTHQAELTHVASISTDLWAYTIADQDVVTQIVRDETGDPEYCLPEGFDSGHGWDTVGSFHVTPGTWKHYILAECSHAQAIANVPPHIADILMRCNFDRIDGVLELETPL